MINSVIGFWETEMFMVRSQSALFSCSCSSRRESRRDTCFEFEERERCFWVSYFVSSCEKLLPEEGKFKILQEFKETRRRKWISSEVN